MAFTTIADLTAVVAHPDELTGGPAAVMVRTETGVIAADDGMREIFEHTRDLGEKDLSLAIAMGEELGVDTPVARYALEQIGDAVGVPREQERP